MNRILVPFDFTEVADEALKFAIQLAERGHADQVSLLNIVEHPSESALKFMGATQMDPMTNVYITKLIQLVKDKLEAKVAEQTSSVNLNYKIQIGNPYQSIASEVTQKEVDLVIMGTSGSEGIDELFVGSNAERVVRSAECPVITLKEAADANDIHDLVFASNFYQVKNDFVKRIKDLQELFDAELRIVKINTPANFTTNRHDLKQMNEFVSKYDIHNYTIDIYNYTNEEDGIIYYAEDIDADMIAIGTNQRTGFNHFLSGSIAEDVVNHSKRPVWTLHLE
jgi:nucleotide-binding universal stress UspA family protein